MANRKKLQRAAVKFRRENPTEHSIVCILISRMADYIRKSGVTEVTVGVGKYGDYYEHAN